MLKKVKQGYHRQVFIARMYVRIIAKVDANVYRHYTTEEGRMTVPKLWSFYWIKVSLLRFIFVYIYIYKSLPALFRLCLS